MKKINQCNYLNIPINWDEIKRYNTNILSITKQNDTLLTTIFSHIIDNKSLIKHSFSVTYDKTDRLSTLVSYKIRLDVIGYTDEKESIK